MFEVLCYGDSNTWGADPATSTRFDRDIRWPGVLQKALGAGYHVIEEGLGGRTTVWEDPIEGHKNGKEYLIPCLATHSPLDLVIIMLGTNDLKVRFSATAQDIAAGAGILVDIVYKSGTVKNPKTPKVLLLVPPPLGNLNGNEEMFEGGRENPGNSSSTLKPSPTCTAANSSIQPPSSNPAILTASIWIKLPINNWEKPSLQK